jgi:hypothetical protein
MEIQTQQALNSPKKHLLHLAIEEHPSRQTKRPNKSHLKPTKRNKKTIKINHQL